MHFKGQISFCSYSAYVSYLLESKIVVIISAIYIILLEVFMNPPLNVCHWWMAKIKLNAILIYFAIRGQYGLEEME